MSKLIAGLFVVLGVVALVFLLSLLFAWPVMLLWNYAMVAAIASAKPIGFWHAWCLLALCGLLVKSNTASVKTGS